MAKELTLEEAKQKIAEMAEAMENQQKEAEEVIADLSAKLDQQAPKSKTTLKVGNKKYVVAIENFIHQGQKYTAKDLKGNSDLVKELIEMESSVLQEA